MSYGLTVDILADILPMQTNTRSVALNTQKVAERMEEELGEEQVMFAHGCPAEWESLPSPDGRSSRTADVMVPQYLELGLRGRAHR